MKPRIEVAIEGGTWLWTPSVTLSIYPRVSPERLERIAQERGGIPLDDDGRGLQRILVPSRLEAIDAPETVDVATFDDPSAPPIPAEGRRTPSRESRHAAPPR